MKSGGSSGSRISALVVDDDFVIRQIHSAMLKSFGVNVQLAVNGKEAVDLFRSGTDVHVVFMDMDMPVMNGIMATRELRAMGVNTMIVGVSSRYLDEDRERFMLAGLNQFYEKPLTMTDIRSLLDEMQG